MTTEYPLKTARFEQVTSTNDVLKERVRSGVAGHGEVVIASHQTGGKGQRGKSWVSEKGENLLFSMVLEPNGDLSSPVDVGNCAILGLLSVVEKLLPVEKVKVKWPNDLLVNGEKIAGLLVENLLEGNQVKSSVIGIGLNVNQMTFPSFDRKATSLKKLSEINYDIEKLAKEIALSILEKAIGHSSDDLRREYQEYLYLKNTIAPFFVDKEVIECKIKMCDEEGRLIVEDEKGVRHIFQNGEISFLK